MADHFQYLASVPIIALGVAIAAHFLRDRQASPLVAAVILLTLTLMTARRTADYWSEQILWEDTLTKDGDCSVAHARLGLIFAEKRQYKAAADQFREVVRLNPSSVDDRLRFASLSMQAGRQEESVAQYRILLTLEPDSIETSLTLAKILSQMGAKEEAVVELETRLKRNPSDVKLHLGLAIVLAELSRFDEAIDQVLGGAASRSFKHEH